MISQFLYRWLENAIALARPLLLNNINNGIFTVDRAKKYH
ncbi:hypothetical protein FDUTEX481_00984 [Tolypothrix sp. PCC 7601]|nr:hypothetical protein FDUTEX481_00984 [Tolypothrix sp. PCC 7601]